MKGAGPPRSGWGRLARLLVQAAAPIVPRHRRGRWLEEWKSEIWHHERSNRGPGVFVRASGAVTHALWMRGEGWTMDSFVKDLRFAARALGRRPGFTAVAVAVLAVGIGGNVAVFSLVNAVLLRPLPFPESDRLVWIWGTESNGTPTANVSPPDFRDYRAADPGMELAAYSGGRSTLSAGGRPETVGSAQITANFIDVLGISVQSGRTFRPEEEVPGSGAAVITDGLWKRMFGQRADILGTTVRVDGEPRTVVGVLPPTHGFLEFVDVYLPLPVDNPDWTSRAAHFIRPIGRLHDGVGLPQAQRRLDEVSRRLEREHPDTNEGWYAQVVPLRDVLVAGPRPTLLTLMAAVLVVLLIAIVNVANLLLARASSRTEEIAVRVAMGASRGRVARQLLTESLVLAGLGGSAGLALAFASVALLRDSGLAIPRLGELSVDGTTLVVTLLLSLAAGLLFGLAPVAQLRTSGFGGALRSSRTVRGLRGREALVALEVALSMVLLVSASLLVRSLFNLRDVDPGLDVEGVIAAPASFPNERFGTPEEIAAGTELLLDELRELRGVRSAAFVSIPPLSGNATDTYVFAPERPPENPFDPSNTAQVRAVTEDYFETMGITVRRGRTFDARDAPGPAPTVAVVNEALARRLWPDADPVGREMRIALDEVTVRVVGVVEGVRQFNLATAPTPAFYLLQRQETRRSGAVVVRTDDPATTAGPLRDAIWSVLPDQGLTTMATLEAMARSTTQANRVQAAAVGAFAVLAAGLAALGIYGVLAFFVGQRSREIGLRLALGADRSRTIWMVVRAGGRLAFIGVLAGTLGSFLVTRLMGSLLFGVQPLDPISFALAPAILTAVVLVASYLPARRAARVQPAVALRND